MHTRGILTIAIAAATLLAVGCDRAGGPPGLVGTLERDRVVLRVEAAETVLERRVEEGTPVGIGEVLLAQDSRRRDALFEAAEAELARAEARLAELVRGPRAERISEARAALMGAEKDLATARSELERTTALNETRLSSDRELDEAERARDLARARRDEAAAALEALLAGTTAEELAQAEATVRAARAETQARRVDVEQTALVARRAGVLERWLVEVGERPAVGQAVGVLLAEDPYALVWLPEPRRAEVSVGDTLTVHVDGLDAPRTGTVRLIETEAAFTPYTSLTERDRARRAFRMEVALPEARDLGSGLGLRVLLPGDG